MTNNIAIAARNFNWGGGLDFIHMLCEALVLKAEEKNAKIYLFIPQKPNTLIKLSKNIRNITRIPYNIFKGKEKIYVRPSYFMTEECTDCFSDLLGEIEIVYHEVGDYFFYRKLKEYKIDKILPVSIKPQNINSKNYIGYIPDLQHKYYPEFFTQEEIEGRDNDFINLLNASEKIIVNAKSVKNDIIKFYGTEFNQEKCKIYNLPYAPLLKNKYEMGDFDKIKKKFNLPKKYFIISNQMWKHKDHITAFKALKELIYRNEKFKDINIVCTGSTYDYRFPDLFEQLGKEIRQMGVEGNVYFLGYIAKSEQLSIMRNSIGVIQPTLFEGGPGGGSVYEAVSMGIPAIVSDIDVNKEIEEENIVFFKTKSVEDLAEKMKEMIKSIPHKYINEEMLLIKSNRRLNRLSEELYRIINE